MNRTRLGIAKSDIVKAFDAQGKRVLNRKEIAKLLTDNREFWRLAQATTTAKFIEFLVRATHLQVVNLSFPSQQARTRFLWRDATPMQVALSLRSRGYFSHYTAVAHHGLTEQNPKVLYVNEEQKPKGRSAPGEISQEDIDRCFSHPRQLSQSRVEYAGYTICLVSTMGEDELGVVDDYGSEGEPIRITNTERTLVDIAVQPEYAGGVDEVLKAYRLASDRVSVNRMAGMLHRIGYVYPYHQVIGFYMERSGAYSKSMISIFKDIEQPFDFYLTRQIVKPRYVSEWRLYVPQGF